MALAHINSDPATRAELSRLADQAGIPRAQFLRVLTRRYGPALVRDLTQPVRAADGDGAVELQRHARNREVGDAILRWLNEDPEPNLEAEKAFGKLLDAWRSRGGEAS